VELLPRCRSRLAHRVGHPVFLVGVAAHLILLETLLDTLKIDARAKQRCAVEIVKAHSDRQIALILTWAEPDLRPLIVARMKQLRRELPEATEEWTDTRPLVPHRSVGHRCFVMT